METVGLLAGIGILPVEFIEAAHIQGYKVVCIAVIPGVEKKLKEKADAYYEISVFKLNKVIKTLLSEGVQEVTMLGKVTKEWLYKERRDFSAGSNEIFKAFNAGAANIYQTPADRK